MNNQEISLNDQLIKYAEDITRLYRELKVENQELIKMNNEQEELFFETILMGFDLINLYDEFLGGHCKRVAYYSNVLANSLDLDENKKKNLKLAALLHDIGLIGIPRDNLNKMFEGKNDTLLRIYRQHPIVKIRPISSSEKFKSVSRIIIAHHENLDGSGFPNGLIGEDIPTESRIIAIANGYDVSKQLKTKRVDPEVIIDEMLKEVGVKYDADLFKEFAKIIFKKDPFTGFIDIGLELLKPGLVLANPILTSNEKVRLLGANTVLRFDHITQIRKYFEFGNLKLPIRVYKPQ